MRVASVLFLLIVGLILASGVVTAAPPASSLPDRLTDAKFWRLFREMQLRNMINAVVGDFAGPKAVRKVAEYVGQHNAVVSAFYVSNVEFYLAGAGPVARGMGSPSNLRFCNFGFELSDRPIFKCLSHGST
jgi:hypothetical protein